MIDLLQKLIQRYRAELDAAQGADISSDAAPDTAAIKDSLSSLLFAESALKKISLCEKYPQHPKQIAVIGPTQVGKSSMVNLLLGSELAEASAMAGFTVHCQGYSIGNSKDQEWAKSYFDGLESQQQSSLDRQVLNEYSLTSADGLPDSSTWQGSVLWDTPDFDSVDSYGYRLPVLKAAALADLIVFTVSREKYADNTVWTMLGRLAELSKPVIMVMNKTPPQYRDELADSVRQKYQRVMAGKAVGELPLYFIDEYKDGPANAIGSTELAQLRTAISSGQLQRPSPEALQLQSKDYIAAHWSQWTMPLLQEHERQAQWKALVDRTAENLVARYRSEYLEGSRNKETFQLALAELLALLEVPGMAQPLSRIRSVVTWPMRKLIATATDSARQSDVPKDDRGEERRLLEELAQHGISQLAVQISEQQKHPEWWSEIEARLGARKHDLLLGYGKGLDNYQTLLQVEIERAAQSLYKNLQQQPATLNGLRAARVSADAAAVVLAVKSGGLGAADLVIAPAMLSLTSMLTEGALGQYMQKVQNDLREYQNKEVASLISRKLRIRLYPLATDSTVSEKISTARLQEAADELGLIMPELDNHNELSIPGEAGK